MIKFLDLWRQYNSLRIEIDGAIADVIRRSAFIGGDDVAAFERDFANFQEAAHCVGVGNGTDAIEITLEALALPRGSEVIVPANSFIASSEAVTRSGYRVVFADVSPLTYTLDPEDVRRRITPRTSAVIAVHLYGQPCDMNELLSIRNEYDLRMIEDCAQAHGARYDGHPVGTMGDAGTFSFYPGKNLGAYGDAGAIITNRSDLAQRCRMIANHGRVSKYDHQLEGRNSRLDGLQAAILRVKLRHLAEWVDRRNDIAVTYSDILAGVDGVVTPAIAAGRRHAFHLYVIRTDRREQLAKFLKEQGIETGIHYPIALPKIKAYAYLGQAEEPMFANLADNTLLSLPIGEHLADEDVRAVGDAVRRFFA